MVCIDLLIESNEWEIYIKQYYIIVMIKIGIDENFDGCGLILKWMKQ